MASYTVKSGDNLSTIAQKNGLTLNQLLSLNPQFAANPHLIRPGQVVTLSGGAQSSAQSSQGGQSQPPVKTQAQVDAEYAGAVQQHPVFAGNSPEAIAYATTTGDFSGLMNSQGKPFSAADQQAAVRKAEAELSPFYQAEKLKETQDTESSLKAKQLSFQNFLEDEKAKFETEKATQDQTAADRGVLFSGGRAQKLQQLTDTFNRSQSSKLASVGSDIGDTARNFGYKFGDTAAQSLSQYFNLGKNNYNANVATGGVTSGGLSSIYNANQGFQGTQINTAKSEAQKRAALALANKGNKLVGSGYTNQY